MLYILCLLLPYEFAQGCNTIVLHYIVVYSFQANLCLCLLSLLKLLTTSNMAEMPQFFKSGKNCIAIHYWYIRYVETNHSSGQRRKGYFKSVFVLFCFFRERERFEVILFTVLSYSVKIKFELTMCALHSSEHYMPTKIYTQHLSMYRLPFPVARGIEPKWRRGGLGPSGPIDHKVSFIHSRRLHSPR